MRNASSTGIRRTSSPRTCAALSIDECVCSEQTTTRLSGSAVRAAASAVSVAIDAVSSIWPCQVAGRPRSCASQPMTCSSSSASAGPVRQRMPTWLSVAVSNSARIAGSEPVFGK